MIAKVFNFKQSNEKVLEAIIKDEHVHYMHIILPQNEAMPEHISNANLYMTVLRGKISIKLNDEEQAFYGVGTVLNIPQGVNMNVKNLFKDIQL